MGIFSCFRPADEPISCITRVDGQDAGAAREWRPPAAAGFRDVGASESHERVTAPHIQAYIFLMLPGHARDDER